ncbi:calcium-binding protein [soil metagenome]
MSNWLKSVRALVNGRPATRRPIRNSDTRRVRLQLTDFEHRIVPAMILSNIGAAYTLADNGIGDIDNSVILDIDGGNVVYTADGSTSTIASVGTIDSLTISLGDGTNSLTLDNTWTFPDFLAGGTDFTCTGGTGTDTLIGNDNGNTFTMSGPNAGTLNITAGNPLVFSNSIEVLAGGSGVDTIVGENDPVTWSLGSTLQYSTGAEFSGIETVQGGSATDTFNISADISGDVLQVRGGADNDLFQMSGDVSQSAILGLNGQSGSDTLSYTANTTLNVDLTITAIDLDGAAGSDGALNSNVSFTDIDRIDGTSAVTAPPNRMTTTSGDDIVTIQSGNDSLETGGNTLLFNNIKDFYAGDGNDVFNISVSHSGFIDGQGGNDQVVFAGLAEGAFVFDGTVIGNTGDDSFAVNTAESWSITGALDGDDEISGSGNDTFQFNTKTTVGGGIYGGAGNDSFDFNSAVTSANVFGDDNSTATDGNDSFNFNTGTLTGMIRGEEGTDTVNYTMSVAVTITASTAAAGYTGNDSTAFSGGFTGINNLTAAGTADLLTGRNLASTWTLTASGATTSYNDATGGDLTFDNFETLQGGTAADTINVSGAYTDSIEVQSGAGNDDFNIQSAASISGIIDGESGLDSINYSGRSTAVAVDLTSADLTGFAGTSTASGGIEGMDILVGSSGVDTLSGSIADKSATFDIDGSNTFTNQAGEVLSFSAMENLSGDSDVDTFNISANHAGDLTGNAEADVFNLTATLTGAASGNAGADHFNLGSGGSVSGTIAGGSETDSLDYSGRGTTVSVDLTAANSAGFTGTATSSGGITGIDDLVGSSATDTLTGSIAGTAATFDIDGSNTFTNGTSEMLSFSAMENLAGDSDVDTFNISANHTGNLTGNAGNDKFVFSGSAFLTGSLTGDALTGDELDFSSSAATVAVRLTNSTSDGQSGNASSILSGSFSTIDIITGATGDSLRGRQADSTWTLGTGGDVVYDDGVSTINLHGVQILVGGAANDTFNVSDNSDFAGTIDGGSGTDRINFSAYSSGNLTVNVTGINVGNATSSDSTSPVSISSFTSVENLTGGSGNDSVNLAVTGRLTGTLDGGVGTDLLSYATYTSSVSVNLATGAATNVNGGVSNVENATGGSGNDYLAGSLSNNLLSGGAGHDIMLGGAGDDTLNGGDGNDILIGGPGADTLNGGNNDDILIGGTTTYDANTNALNAIRAEWSSSSDVAVKVARIRGFGARGGLNGGYTLTATSVNDDGTSDSLNGDAGNDWAWDLGSDSTASIEFHN